MLNKPVFLMCVHNIVIKVNFWPFIILIGPLVLEISVHLHMYSWYKNDSKESNPNEKVCVWICLTLQSQMTRSALTISFWVIYVWLCRDSSDFFSAYLSGRPIYVWLCRGFDIHTEQLSAENRPTFRRIQTGLLCRARSNIFIREP